MPKVLTETKHFKVTRSLRSYIQAMSEGSIVPPVRELMEKTGGSHGTVIKALSSLNKENFIYRPAGRMSYIVAPLSEKPLARIAVLRPDYPSTEYESIISTLYHAVRANKYSFEQHYYRKLENLDINRETGDCDAIILLPNSETPPEHLLKALEKPSRPVILLSQHWYFDSVSQIAIDDRRVGELAVEYLAQRGHKKIMFAVDQPANSTNEERITGWKNKMLQLELVKEKELEGLFFNAEIQSAQSARDVTYNAFSKLLDHGMPECTAILINSLEGGLAIPRALREHNIRVPEDISLICYGGESNLADYLYPRLTMIRADVSNYGAEVIAMLEEHFSNKVDQHHKILLQPYIAEGDSVNNINKQLIK